MKLTKKLMALLLALAMALSLAACSNGGDQESASGSGESQSPEVSASSPSDETGYGDFTTVESGKLIMSTNAQFPPYEMVADGAGFENTGFEGIDVEIAYAIAQKLGLELVVDSMGFDAALLAAQNGQSDMVMAGVTVNDERLAVMDFSNSYATGVQVIIVKEGSPIQSVDDLSSAGMIGCQKATTGYIYCSAPVEEGGYGEDHVTAYENGAMAVQALADGQVDAVVIDNEPAKAYVADNPGLKILETEFVEEDYAIGVQKGNAELLNAINKAMAELKDEGVIQSIIDKYIPAE